MRASFAVIVTLLVTSFALYDAPPLKASPCDQILRLLSLDINQTYQCEFSSMKATPTLTPAGRAYGQASTEYIKASGDYVFYRTADYERVAEQKKQRMIDAWHEVEREGQNIARNLMIRAQQQGIRFEEKTEPFRLPGNVEVETTRIYFSREGSHAINRFADLLSKLEINPVRLVIQPSFVVQGIRGVYMSAENSLVIEPAVILNGTLSDQSVIHETMHLLMAELVAIGQIDPAWGMMFVSWTELSKLPGDQRFYPHYMSVQELLTFGFTAIRAVYHLGELEGGIAASERDLRHREALNIIDGMKMAAERILMIAQHVRQAQPSLSVYTFGGVPHVRGRLDQYATGVDDIKYDVLYPVDQRVIASHEVSAETRTNFFAGVENVARVARSFERISRLLYRGLNNPDRRVQMTRQDFENILQELRSLDLPLPIDSFLAQP